MKRLIVVCLTLIFSNGAYATVPFGGHKFLAEIELDKAEFVLRLNNNLPKSCFSSPQNLTDTYEGELRRLGLKIVEPGLFTQYIFNISTTGFDIGVNCIVMIDVALDAVLSGKLLWTFGEQAADGPIHATIWNDAFVITRPESEIQDYLVNQVRGIVNDLYIEVARSKQRIEELGESLKNAK